MSDLLSFVERLRHSISDFQTASYSFLIGFARKATDVMATTHISEEDFINYFNLGLTQEGKEKIPSHIRSAMLLSNIWG